MLQSSKAFVCHSKACTQLHQKMLQRSKVLFGTQKLAPNCTTKCFKAQSSCLAHKSLHPTPTPKKMLQSSKLLFGTQKLAPNSNTKKCFKAQSFCLALKSLHPIAQQKCSKTQSFCLALKSLHPIAQQKCSKTQSFCLALKSLHPIIGNASKLKIQASNFFKMRQDPAQKKDTIKTPPSKHKTQSLSS